MDPDGVLKTELEMSETPAGTWMDRAQPSQAFATLRRALRSFLGASCIARDCHEDGTQQLDIAALT